MSSLPRLVQLKFNIAEVSNLCSGRDAELSKTKADLATAYLKVSELEEERQEVSRQKQRWHQRCQELQELAGETQARLEEVQREKDALSDRCTQLQDHATSLEGQLSAADTAMDEISKRYGELQSLVNTLEQQSSAPCVEEETITAQCNELQHQLDETKNVAMKELRSQLDTAKSQLSIAQEETAKLSTAHQDCGRVKGQLNDTRTKLTAANKAIDHHNAQSNEHHRQVEEVKKQTSAVQKEKEKALQQVGELETQLEASRKDCTGLKRHRQEAEEKAASAEEEKKQLSSAHAKAMEAINSQLQSSRNEVEQLQGQVQDSKVRWGPAGEQRQELEDVKGKLSSAQAHTKKVAADPAKALQHAEELQTELKASRRVCSLQEPKAELMSARAGYNTLASILQDVESKLHAARTTNSTISSRP